MEHLQDWPSVHCAYNLLDDAPIEMYNYSMVDCFEPGVRSDLMRRVRSRETGIETYISQVLTDLGFEVQKNVDHLPGRPDIIIPEYFIAVFVHGCFWHGHRSCKKGSTLPKTNSAFWRRKIQLNKKRDRKASTLLRQAGWSVIVVWECNVSKSSRQSRKNLRRRKAIREALRLLIEPSDQ